MRFLIALCCLLALSALIGASPTPSNFVISDFPFFRQENEYFCGEASMQMVFKYWTGVTVPQGMFSSVARASEDYGTQTKDIVRALSFSRASFPVFPNSSVAWRGSGYEGYDIGFSVEAYDLQRPWLLDLRETLSKGIPVIVLQQYWFDDPGGHYRVAMGYNTTHIFMKDPYDRDGMPRDLALSNDDFAFLWRYTETGSREGPRYWGAAASPWTIPSISISKIRPKEYAVNVMYTFSSPFEGLSAIPTPQTALFTMLEVKFDTSLFNVSQTTIIDSQRLSSRQSGRISFGCFCLGDAAACASSNLQVRVSGMIQGITGSAPTTGDDTSPPYAYTDFIGTAWTKFIVK